jgi:putative copper export protein
VSAVLAGAAVLESPTKTAYVASRWVEFAATALFYGGLAFVAGLWPAGAGVPRVRMFLSWVWVFGFVSTLAALVIGGVWGQGKTVADAVQNPVLRATLGADFGREWSMAAVLWLLALIPLVALDRQGDAVVRALPWRLATIAVGLAALRVTDLASHAKETGHPVVTQLADLVHLTAMTVWLGGLVMLLVGVLPRKDASELSAVVPRYSRLAMGSVAAIVASGAVLAWELLGPFGNVTATTYGRLLLLKVALLAVIGLAAMSSKTWVAHRLDFAVVLQREARMVRPFVVSVAAETALVIAVLAVASLVVTANPGR